MRGAVSLQQPSVAFLFLLFNKRRKKTNALAFMSSIIMNFSECSYSLDLIILCSYLEESNGGLGIRKKREKKDSLSFHFILVFWLW